MAEDDIYGSKARYELFVKDLAVLIKPKQFIQTKRKYKGYYYKNSANLEYFEG